MKLASVSYNHPIDDVHELLTFQWIWRTSCQCLASRKPSLTIKLSHLPPSSISQEDNPSTLLLKWWVSVFVVTPFDYTTLMWLYLDFLSTSCKWKYHGMTASVFWTRNLQTRPQPTYLKINIIPTLEISRIYFLNFHKKISSMPASSKTRHLHTCAKAPKIPLLQTLCKFIERFRKLTLPPSTCPALARMLSPRSMIPRLVDLSFVYITTTSIVSS
jgi:hypothetical protein